MLLDGMQLLLASLDTVVSHAPQQRGYPEEGCSQGCPSRMGFVSSLPQFGACICSPESTELEGAALHPCLQHTCTEVQGQEPLPASSSTLSCPPPTAGLTPPAALRTPAALVIGRCCRPGKPVIKDN